MKLGVFLGVAPILVLTLGGSLLMLSEALTKRRVEEGERRDAGPSSELALGTCITHLAMAAIAAAIYLKGPGTIDGIHAVEPWLIADRFSLFFTVVLGLGGALASLLAGGYLPEHRLDRGEFYPLLTFSTVGAVILVSAGDLLSLFLGLETMSLGTYAMVGFRRASPRSAEAAAKYFLLGSFAAALLLYGGALLYGATGHTDLAGIAKVIGGSKDLNLGLVVIGIILVLAGLAFKVSAVPFHMWTPDAYEGAPTPATSYMAVAVKSAAFGVLVRVLLTGFSHPGLTSWSAGWPPIVAALAVLTMTVGNLIAGQQESVKRMLAYSSIAHAGYALVGLVAASKGAPQAQASILFYMLAYTASTAGAFGALILCGSRGAEAVSYEDLAGLGKRHPLAAMALSFFLLSLTGVPPTAGFFAKLYVAKAGIEGGLYPLVVILMLNSVVAAYYYLRVMVFMYMREPAPGAPTATPMKSGYVSAALVFAALIVMGVGLLPGSSLAFAVDAVLVAANSRP